MIAYLGPLAPYLSRARTLALAWRRDGGEARLLDPAGRARRCVAGRGLAHSPLSRPHDHRGRHEAREHRLLPRGRPRLDGDRPEIDPKGGSRVLGRKVLDQDGKGIIRRASRWRCDRLSRRFVAKGMLDGQEVTATYGVRTPACKDRLEIGLPLRAQPGRRRAHGHPRRLGDRPPRRSRLQARAGRQEPLQGGPAAEGHAAGGHHLPPPPPGSRARAHRGQRASHLAPDPRRSRAGRRRSPMRRASSRQATR